MTDPFAKERDAYIKSRPKSQALHQRAMKLFPAFGATHVARMWDPFSPYIERADGSHSWDVDGHEYIEYGCGHGGMILGHNHPDIVAAITDQLTKGTHFSASHPYEVEWAEIIQSMIPCAELIEAFASGQEANIMAVRVARAASGRKKILRFYENFHGWSDELSYLPSPGLLDPNVTQIRMNDMEALERELATEEYAIVFTEGGGAHMGGQIPWEDDVIRAVGPLAKKHGTVWLLDEVVTGFRDGPDGWGGVMGLDPDLKTLGKIVAGGLAQGVLVGKKEIMSIITPKLDGSPCIMHSGTWNALPLICRAGIAAMKLLQDGSVAKKVNASGAYLRNKINTAMKEKSINWRVYGRSVLQIYFGPIDFEPENDALPPTKDEAKIVGGGLEKNKIGIYLLQRGIQTVLGRMFILNIAHSKEDLDKTAAALFDSVIAAQQDGILGELPSGDTGLWDLKKKN